MYDLYQLQYPLTVAFFKFFQEYTIYKKNILIITCKGEKNIFGVARVRDREWDLYYVKELNQEIVTQNLKS